MTALSHGVLILSLLYRQWTVNPDRNGDRQRSPDELSLLSHRLHSLMTQPLGSHVLTYLIQLLERGVRIIRYYYWRLIRLQDPPNTSPEG